MPERFESLSDFVYEYVRNHVISGEWPVGMRINEKELAEKLHVSRTPIRSALARIYREGLLEYSKNWGYRVRVVTQDDVREIYRIRVVLEALATYEASLRMDDRDFAVMEDIIRRSQEALDNGRPEEVLECSTEFNEQIFRFAGMPRLTMIQKTLHEYLLRFRNVSFSGKPNDRRQLAVEEHAAIVRAMRLKDKELLRQLTEEHLSHSERYILEELEMLPPIAD